MSHLIPRTPELRSRIETMRELGLSVEKIAREIGVAPCTASIMMQQMGIGTSKRAVVVNSPRAKSTWPKQDVAELLRLYGAGTSNARIAQALERTKAAIGAKLGMLRLQGMDVGRGELRHIAVPEAPSRKWALPVAPVVKPAPVMRPCLGVNCNGKMFASSHKGNRLCNSCRDAAGRAGCCD